MTIIFLNKNTPSLMATKIIKKSGISFVFAQRNAAHCISGQNNMVKGGVLAAQFSGRAKGATV